MVGRFCVLRAQRVVVEVRWEQRLKWVTIVWHMVAWIDCWRLGLDEDYSLERLPCL